MRKRKLLLTVAAVLAAMLLWRGIPSLQAQTPAAAALTGQVSSQEEGPMEGVLVSAKKVGGTITVTVATEKQGRYSFPRKKLEPGQYSLRLRAVGYETNDPGPVEITAQKAAKVDFKLRKTDDLSQQLTNTEWMISAPGTDEQKAALLNCTGCHTLERPIRSHHDTTEFMQVLERMSGYAPGASPAFPQRRVGIREGDGGSPERFRKMAEYLSTINLGSASKWEYPLKTLPRPTGRSTRVVITEYALPREITQPHDVILDPEGMAWYSDFGQQYIGRLDPKTGKVTEFPVPELKPGSPRGGLDLELDKEGNIWYGLMLQGGIAKFDRKAQKFQMFPLPKEINNNVAQQAMVMPIRSDVDGKVWMNNVGRRGIHRMDLATGQFENINPYGEGGGAGMEGGGHSVYGIAADSQNNLYFMDFGSENIGRADAKTGQTKLFPTPTRNSAPRRGHMDSQDRLWFAEFRTNKVGMFDTRTEKFQEWALPTPWTGPYDVVLDKNGELWTGGMTSDRIVRLDPKTGQATEYLLPIETNVRRVFVDNTTTPVTFWVGNNHHASVIKLEPLD